MTDKSKIFGIDEIQGIIDLAKNINGNKDESEKDKMRDTLTNIIHKKLNLRNGKIVSDNKYPPFFDHGSYRYTFVVSDIHADLRRLLMILLQAGIITLSEKGKIIDHKNIIIEIGKLGKDSSYCYELLYKYEILFNIENCHLIVLGDIVDGRRLITIDEEYVKEVDDTNGIFELLIHIILYNLRILGSEKKSTVSITIGNHELITLFNIGSKLSNIINTGAKYVHASAFNVFGTYNRRALALIPFYALQLATFILINKEKNIVGLFSHGSFASILDQNGTESVPFVNVTMENLTIKHKKIEKLLNECFNSDFVETIDVDLYKKENDLAMISEKNFLQSVNWSRMFANDLKKNTCGNIMATTTGNKIGFVVMGHCITSDFVRDKNAIAKYPGCDKRECIYVTCVKDKIPRLILVDSALSGANIMCDDGKVSWDKKTKDTGSRLKNLIECPDKDGSVFSEILLLETSNNSSYYNFYRVRLNFDNNQTEYFKIEVDNDETFPNAMVNSSFGQFQSSASSLAQTQEQPTQTQEQTAQTQEQPEQTQEQQEQTQEQQDQTQEQPEQTQEQQEQTQEQQEQTQEQQDQTQEQPEQPSTDEGDLFRQPEQPEQPEQPVQPDQQPTDEGDIFGPTDEGDIFGPTDEGDIFGPTDEGDIFGPTDRGEPEQPKKLEKTQLGGRNYKFINMNINYQKIYMNNRNKYLKLSQNKNKNGF
jgi:flagellar motor protein MotB